MAFGSSKSSVSQSEILDRVTEADILSFYLGITEIPCIMNSPLRVDSKPSFGLYSRDGNKISFVDFSTGDRGGVFDLLGKMWGCSYKDVLIKIEEDIPHFTRNTNIKKYTPCVIKRKDTYSENLDLQCKIREWKDYDLEYWKSYGITIEWLKYAEVYPISHKIVIKEGKQYTFVADKYAYAYVERKENKITLKIYQPFNTKGFKWSNKHDSSVISLWTKIPEYGDRLCICSSLKDALCLWINTGIPSLAIQGEGYRMSDTAISELKRRYKQIYICLDNDGPGIKDAEKLAEETGFTNVVLPYFEGGKDISDLFKLKGRKEFLNIISPLFNLTLSIECGNDLPFEY